MSNERVETPVEEHKAPQVEEIRCPFCSQTQRIGASINRAELPFLVHNRQLDNLLELEI